MSRTSTHEQQITSLSKRKERRIRTNDRKRFKYDYNINQAIVISETEEEGRVRPSGDLRNVLIAKRRATNFVNSRQRYIHNHYDKNMSGRFHKFRRQDDAGAAAAAAPAGGPSTSEGRGLYRNQTEPANDAGRNPNAPRNPLRFINAPHKQSTTFTQQPHRKPFVKGDGNGENAERPKRKHFFGFKKLEDLLAKDTEEALTMLNGSRDALFNYLNLDEVNGIAPDVIVLMFEVLAHVRKSTFNSSVAQLLHAVKEHKFFDSARAYILQLPVEDSAKKNKGRRFWNAYDQFFSNVLGVLDTLVETLPTTAMDVVPDMLAAILFVLPNIEEKHHVRFDDAVGGKSEELQLKMAHLLSIKESEERKRQNADGDDEEDVGDPPNDFRTMAIYPTGAEITTKCETFLRRNIVRGAYRDVEHYLDVQFRLLREDFVATLRAGILDYFEMLKGGERRRLSSVRVYKKVFCMQTVAQQQQIGYRVHVVKPGSIRNIENTRRFMFGSLVLLTHDDFRTILFGKILDRDKKLLAAGDVVVGFDAGIKLETDREYLFVECTIYFEPYYQVLQALQAMPRENFPMREYLVDVLTDVQMPTYLAEVTPDPLAHNVGDLNPSQLRAYNAALTSKFCIIQGPPGTGKTYLALKVARELIESGVARSVGPMLVICYTNHALDQFLDGLLPSTEKLVRVGGQSRSENLKKYNLRNLRMIYIPSEYFEAQNDAMARLDQCSQHVGVDLAMLSMISEGGYIINFENFHEIDDKYHSSWFAKAKPRELVEWLLYQPDNSHQLKYADFENIDQLIESLLQWQHIPDLCEQQPEESPQVDEDDPMLAQAKRSMLNIDEDGHLVNIARIASDSTLAYVSVHSLSAQIAKDTKDIVNMRKNGQQYTPLFYATLRQLMEARNAYEYISQQFAMLKRMRYNDEPVVDYHQPNQMAPEDRWRLYEIWVRRYRKWVWDRYERNEAEYRKAYGQVQDAREILDLHKLRQVDVVGMTTTGAARLHRTLQALKCPIVIVEEAAEVLEAHIITALSPHCQQLILIGDHKQLRPSTADMKITKHYQLGVSLFERMVLNGLHCHTLNVQHRMRPEIARLVCPAIYPELLNHESVTVYPPMRGVDAPLFFITHTHRETESVDQSKENDFEAEYLIQLARYLVLNNYAASQITIIAAYSGQWFAMKNLKRQHHILADMRICVLDNFQGEENDIILLSLVRNNEEGKNGFLNMENRVCVALSRAKLGLYIMGNMDQLCNGSSLWRDVRDVLVKQDALGSHLTVRCTNHPTKTTQLFAPEDFSKVSEGGCDEICGLPMDCGHTCSKLCHNTPHTNYKCHAPCTRTSPQCDFEHICPSRCYETCAPCKVPKTATLPCGHTLDIPCHRTPDEFECYVPVHTKLPCDHEANKPCHVDPDKFDCPHECSRRVEPCGHACRMRCHIRNDPNHERYRCYRQCVENNRGCTMPAGKKHPCQKVCAENCDLCSAERLKERNCGHFYRLPCHADVADVECHRPCKRTIPTCGHPCTNDCYKPCGPCIRSVRKTITACGHQVDWLCASEPAKKNCTHLKCEVVLACGHVCALPCGKDCTTGQCVELVASSLEASPPCGHTPLMVPCYLQNAKEITEELMTYCSAPCGQQLPCGHECAGTCGACAQGRFHADCAQRCQKILICGHACTTPCVANCQPCQRSCEQRCVHNACTKPCGAVCTPCREPCTRACRHQQCTRKCGERCNVPPCREPCTRWLPCEHECVGFCGDPCPPLCRQCDAEELTEIFLGNEADEGARFVYLAKCQHTLEAEGLETWFRSQNMNGLVQVLTCPRCKTPVEAARYRDYIKAAYTDVLNVKKHYFGSMAERYALAEQLRDDLNAFMRKYKDQKSTIRISAFILERMKTTASRGKKMQRQELSKLALESLRARFDIANRLFRRRYDNPREAGNRNTPLTVTGRVVADEYLQFLLDRLTADDGKSMPFGQQHVDEFQAELQRFGHIMGLARVLSVNPTAHTLIEYKSCAAAIYTFKPFDANQDGIVVKLLSALFEATKSGLAISETERRQIVGAIGLSVGHWYKCPRGHIYVIADCGGPNQVGKCPECGAAIGGLQHRIIPGNRLATEMDGARVPAYPVFNNMDNYDPEELNALR